MQRCYLLQEAAVAAALLCQVTVHVGDFLLQRPQSTLKHRDERFKAIEPTGHVGILVLSVA